MESLELRNGTVLLTVGDGVLEVFERAFDGSLRIPVSWLGIQVRPARHDRVTVRIGQDSAGGPVLYGPDAQIYGGFRQLDIDTGDEARLRGFLAGVAAAAGRAVQP